MQKPYLVLAYYCLTPIENPHEEVRIHKEFFQGRDITCRIYISKEGINGQQCAFRSDALAYIDWMRSRPQFASTPFKIHAHNEQVFPRVTVKVRPLVAIDAPCNLAERGQSVSPKQWKQMLEQNDGHLLIDVRNDYEWKIGHFKGAELPNCSTFRDFETYANELEKRCDKRTAPVMMYCTGGIRCELYSSILKTKGFEKVYQLDGGIINYGLEVGNNHWRGKLFVFDDRLSIPICDEPNEVIGTCLHCGAPIDFYYNCANMDCNELFLCCVPCLEKFAACCCQECMKAPRLRAYEPSMARKPFRKWYHYLDKKTPKN